MILRELWVSGYRSIRQLRLRLGRVNVLVGPNGCGKSNLHRSMYLLTAAARGEFARTLAEEGGMPSVLWAGARKDGPVRMTLGVTVDEWSYELTCGLPKARDEFPLDPIIKSEQVHLLQGRGKKVIFVDREDFAATLRDPEGRRTTHPQPLFESESVLSQIRDAHLYPEMTVLDRELTSWRFYHHFRTDTDSPLRQPQVVVQTPVLHHDGRDLAAVLMTLLPLGRKEELDHAVDKAFPGATLEFDGEPDRGRYVVALRMPGIRRPFDARELSDGTLRYLCLLGALLSPRPPALIALNEPETSIHPDLLEPLAQLIADAARDSQLWVTTHSHTLAHAIADASGQPPIELEMLNGETRVVGQGLLDR